MEALRRAAATRIAKQTEGLEPEEVDKIVLNGQAVLPDVLQTFVNLTQLTLVSMKPSIKDLVSLLSLQPWRSLKLLELSDNAITVPTPFSSTYPSLRRLMLTNNKINELEEVKRLAVAFPNVEVLDLMFNPVNTEERFGTIFNLFPSLVALDSRQKDGTEVIVEDIDESGSEITTSEEDDEDSEEGEESTASEEESSDDDEDEEEDGNEGSAQEPPAKKQKRE